MRIENLELRILNGPVCRFGPGGDYVSIWPADREIAAKRPKNTIAGLLNVLAGVIEALRGGRPGYAINGPAEIADYTVEREKPFYVAQGTRADRTTYTSPDSIVKNNRRVCDQRWLFADDWRAGGAVGRKPTHRIRAHRAIAKKRVCFAPAESRTLFEPDFKGAKTA